MTGVVNLVLIFRSAGVAAGAVRKIFADGKIGLTDAGVLLGAAVQLKALASLDPTRLLAEAKDLDSAEAKALVVSFYEGVAA